MTKGGGDYALHDAVALPATTVGPVSPQTATCALWEAPLRERWRRQRQIADSCCRRIKQLNIGVPWQGTSCTASHALSARITDQ